jgi:hypothetical protein
MWAWSTTTKTGLKVRCELDHNSYPKGIKVSDAEMEGVNLTRHDFHGEWNYTIAPKTLTLENTLRCHFPARARYLPETIRIAGRRVITSLSRDSRIEVQRSPLLLLTRRCRR